MRAGTRLGSVAATLTLVTIMIVGVHGGPRSRSPESGPPAARPPAAPIAPTLATVFEGPAAPGQAFVARRPDYTLALRPEAATFHLAPAPGAEADGGGVLRARLVGADGDARVEARAPLRARAHHFVGSDPAGWRHDIPLYGEVAFRDVWPGVDVVWHDDGRGLTEYDFVIAPDADPSVIRLAFDGVTRAPELAADGDLRLHTAAGVLTHRRPVAWQEHALRREELASRFVVADGAVAFEVDGWDCSAPLVIDPTLVYSTFVGGDASDKITGLALAPDGTLVVVGETNSLAGPAALDFPVKDALPGHGQLAGYTNPPPEPRPHPLNRKLDAFVGRFDTAESGASSLVSMTYFGGALGDDRVFALALDATGRIHIGGTTSSRDLPLMNPLQTCKSADGSVVCDLNMAFIARLSADGGALEYASYLNGHDTDVVGGLAVAPDGLLHVGGRTYSSVAPAPPVAPSDTNYHYYFPITADGFMTVKRGSAEGFLLVLDLDAAQAAQLEYGTLFGGCSSDEVRAIAVDPAGLTVLTGSTQSCADATKPFPIANALQPTYAGGLTDTFVARLDTSLAGPAGLVFSTFLGGNNDENDMRRPGLAIDAEGKIHLGGTTSSGNFPTTAGAAQRCPVLNPAYASLYTCDPATGTFSGALPPTNALLEGYVATLSPEGALLHATFVGGPFVDQINALDVRDDGLLVFVGGSTTSSGLASTCAPQTTVKGGRDAFLATLRLTPAGAGFTSQRALWTYLGGGADEFVEGLAFDPDHDSVALAGTTTWSSGVQFPTTASALQATQPGASPYENGYLTEIALPYECAPDLVVQKSAAPDPVEPGCALTYTIHVDNKGVLPATDVILEDALPAAVSLVTATATQGTCTGTTLVTCELGTLAPFEAATVTIVVLVDAGYSPTQPPFVNTAWATALEAEPELADNQSSVTSHVTPASPCGCGVPAPDGDGDGAADCVDGCPDDPTKTAPGPCGCGVADVDSDLDGTPDCLEPPNAPPVVELTGPTSVASEATATFSFTVLDTPGDTFLLVPGTPDCGAAGTFIAASLTVTGNQGTFQCELGAGPTTTVVSLQVVDAAGEPSDVASVVVDVEAPVAPASWIMLGNGKLGGAHHKFKLSCDPSAPEPALQVKWAGHLFELTDVVAASCDDEPGIDPGMPAAPFDAHAGSGVGTLDGAPGATVTWTFTDAGEPGFEDTATLEVVGPQGQVVLQIGGMIFPGNHQAQVQ